MSVSSAVAALRDGGDDGDLCAPFLSVLPVTGVAISTLGDPFGSETVCASDDVAARLDEIQLDLGEGPCWQAMETGLPVLEHDLRLTTADRWPMALSAMRDTGLGATFAFPMHLGHLAIGAVDLYADARVPLPAGVVRDAVTITEAAARQVLRRALIVAMRDDDGVGDGSAGTYSRREVHQASGMLAAQTGAAADDALLILRGHAYAAGRSVRDLAADVIARTIDFSHPSDRNDSAS